VPGFKQKPKRGKLALREKQEREEAERLLRSKKDYEETFESLEQAREFLLAVYPNLHEKIEAWRGHREIFFMNSTTAARNRGKLKKPKFGLHFDNVSKAIPSKAARSCTGYTLTRSPIPISRRDESAGSKAGTSGAIFRFF
jgi:hypothetical protein